MRGRIEILRRVMGIGLAWGIAWTVVAMIVVVIIGIADPASIGPGEGPWGATAIFGPMGIFSGVAFAILLSIVGRGTVRPDLSLAQAAGWGILGSAIVQLAYLGHGDEGLVANVKMALVFCVFGGAVATVWLGAARIWARRN